MKQIPFPLALETAFVFDNFYTTQPGLPDALRQAVETTSPLGLIGQTASGKTHLLQAVCHYARQQGKTIAYVPMRQFAALSPEALPWQAEVVCVDDIDLAAGHTNWEQQLFRLLNQSHDKAVTLLISATQTGSAFDLPDLHSRVQALPTVHLPVLDDGQIQQAIVLHAHSRGMVLAPHVLAYMVRYLSRNMQDMVVVLDKLEQATLQDKKKVTVNMVKQVVN